MYSVGLAPTPTDLCENAFNMLHVQSNNGKGGGIGKGNSGKVRRCVVVINMQDTFRF